jgi:hypothetical protein
MTDLPAPITFLNSPAPQQPDGAPPLPHPFKPLAPEPSIGGETGRALETARSLIERGADPERVKAALIADGHDADLLDDRTPAERRHDDTWGVPNAVAPSDYYFALPQGVGADFNEDARSLAAGLGMALNDGNAFLTQLVGAMRVADAAVNAGDTSTPVETRAKAIGAKHLENIKQAYGARFDQAAQDVAEILDLARQRGAPDKLLKHLTPGSVLLNPMLFARLANYGARMRLWSDSRPTR